MLGLVNVNKPPQWTSRDVVNRVQRLVRPAKAGHAGTLDPLATGVLVVAIGSATRLIEYVQRLPKHYRGTFLLGRTSPSDDTELEPTLLPDAPVPTHHQIEEQLGAFVGEIEQRPPIYSAIKVAGQKAYDLARRGTAIELAPRPVTIHSIQVVRYDYPELVLDIECGSGTYIRSLGRDLAIALNTRAVMSALVRTAIGPFSVEQAISPEELTAESLRGVLESPGAALQGLPTRIVSPAEAAELRFGRTIISPADTLQTELVALDAQGDLVAILRPRGEHHWGPKLVFPSRDTAIE